jgi:hypothetical protein
MIRKLAALFKRTYRYRSSITGKMVTESYAKANPDTTVRERV